MVRFISFVLLIIFFLGCKGEKRYHDEDVFANLKWSDSTEVFQEAYKFQQKMNNDFKDPETSPLTDKQRKNFRGLSFFKPDKNYRVVAKLVRTPEALPFLMPTTTNRTPEYIKYGIVEFTLFENSYTLNVYQSQQLKSDPEFADDLFLLFTDATNGRQTYGGGRYIDLLIPEGDTIIIDFNKAYNPYCAYNKKYSCPLVPKENNLGIEILAGVKAYKK